MKDILKIYFRQNVACDVGQISTGLGQGTKNFMDEKIRRKEPCFILFFENKFIVDLLF